MEQLKSIATISLEAKLISSSCALQCMPLKLLILRLETLHRKLIFSFTFGWINVIKCQLGFQTGNTRALTNLNQDVKKVSRTYCHSYQTKPGKLTQITTG